MSLLHDQEMYIRKLSWIQGTRSSSDGSGACDSLVQKNDLESIDILSIDTEGNDMQVIIESIHSLHKILFLESEYHIVNQWQKSDLQDLVDILDQYNFDCFWQSNQGKLWRLTGCWHDSYYEKCFWSNITCYNRNKHTLHQAMVAVAEPKITFTKLK